ncbi:MAG: hypothetical protein MUE95_06000 [Cyclobacteriaceae bacterium]|jgi:hypothetical protein|nr:hypothetical protein [Cyclobacteriaceae bacterium]
MDIKALDTALQAIIETRTALGKIGYNDPSYDELEEKLHDQEDDFQDTYGNDLEKVIQQVHDQHCPDNDVLLPIAYLGDGVPVELEKHPAADVRLVLEANPPRLFLRLKNKQQLVWEGK